MRRARRTLLGVVSGLGAAVFGRRRARGRQAAEIATAGRTSLLAGPSPGQTGQGATRDLTPAEISTLRPNYDPHPDGDPDPGEIIWTWVPYVENDGRGKDRPVLIVARIGEDAVAGCYLSTKPRDGFISVGRGAWDPRERESFVNPERMLRIADTGMRREGHVLDRTAFLRAVERIAKSQGFSA